MAEKPIGDRVYLRGDVYAWRGRVNGKPTRLVLRHAATGAVAKLSNMNKTEAKRIGRDISTDVETGGGKYFPAAKASADGLTVREAWALYMKRDGDKHITAPEKRSHFDNIIAPAIGDKPLLKVTRRECAAIIDRVLTAAHDKGQKGNAAINVQKNMKRFFEWCADTGYGATGLEASPMAAIKAKPIDVKLTQRSSRGLDDAEIVLLFRALDRFAHGPISRKNAREQRIRTAQALETLLRALCRREEIFAAQWPWMRPEGLFIPATKATAGRNVGFPLLLPLTPSMKALIGDRPEGIEDDAPIFGANVYWLARGIETVREIMTEIACEDGSNADYATRQFDGVDNPYYFTLHDFRRTGKRILRGAQRPDDGMPMFPVEVREAMLNHREKGIAAIYNSELDSPDYLLPQRRAAGVYYNEYLDRLKAQALQPQALAA